MTLNFNPRHRWRRRVLVALAVVLVLLAAGGWYVTRPARLAGIAASLLGQAVGGIVHVKTAHLAWNGQLELDGLEVDAPGLTGLAAKVLHADRVRARLNWGSLLLGQVRVTDVMLVEPTLYITQEPNGKGYTYDRLTWRSEQHKDSTPPPLPRVMVDHGVLRFGQRVGRTVQPQATRVVQGSLQPSTDHPHTYTFALRLSGKNQAKGAQVRGRFDLLARRITAELVNFRFHDRQRYFLPARMRAWWDRLNIAGSLPKLQISYNRDAQGDFDGVLAVKNVALNLPTAGLGLPVRLSGVTGRFRLHDNTLTIEHLTGQAEGIACAIDGRIQGMTEDAAFHLHITTQPFELKPRPHYLDQLPDAARRIFTHYNPNGRFQVDLSVDRAKAGGKVAASGVVHVLDAKMRYMRFPYPAQHIHGDIRVQPDRIELGPLTGEGLGGGKLSLVGTIVYPGRDAQVDATVVGQAVPIDHDLLAALKSDQRKALTMFMDRGAYTKLIDAGLIRSTDPSATAVYGPVAGTSVNSPPRKRGVQGPLNTQQTPPLPRGANGGQGIRLMAVNKRQRFTASPVPLFNLGGKIALHVKIHRDAGPDKPKSTTTRIKPAGPVGLIFSHWPYPMQAIGGTVTITPDHRVVLQEVALRGPTGAVGQIDGEVTPDPAHHSVLPNLHITRGQLPIDPLLLASIPSPQDQWVRQLHMGGMLAAKGDIVPGQATDQGRHKVDYTIHMTLDHDRAAPFGGTYALADMQGGLTIQSGKVTLRGVAAKHDKSVLTASGTMQWGKAGPSFALKFTGTALNLEPALLDLLPPALPARARLKAAMDQYHPAGRFNMQLDYQGNPAAGRAYTLQLQPRTLTLDMDMREQRRRVELSDMSGSAVVRPDKVELNKLHGKFAGGAMTVSGLVSLDGNVKPVGRASRPSFAEGERLAATANDGRDARPTKLPALALPGAALTFDVQADGFDRLPAAFLPAQIRQLLDSLHLNGAYKLTNARLLSRPHAKDGTRFSFDGQLHLTDAQMELGAPVRGLEGALLIHARQRAGQSRPDLQLELDADHLRIAGRRATALHVAMRTDPTGQVLQIESMRGRLYGGVMVGRGRFDLKPAGDYQFHATLEDVLVEPFMDHNAQHPDMTAPGTASSPTTGVAHRHKAKHDEDDSPGRLTASLSLGGVYGKAASRRGHGAFQVIDAQLFAQPLSMALLQAANLNLPSTSAFDRASARFTVDGPTVHFDELRFDAHPVAIIGTGTMSYPGGALDLTMYSRNPGGLNLGPLSEMLDILRDQVICIRVDGTVSDPDAHVVSFNGLRQSLDKLFGDLQERRPKARAVRPQ